MASRQLHSAAPREVYGKTRSNPLGQVQRGDCPTRPSRATHPRLLGPLRADVRRESGTSVPAPARGADIRFGPMIPIEAIDPAPECAQTGPTAPDTDSDGTPLWSTIPSANRRAPFRAAPMSYWTARAPMSICGLQTCTTSPTERQPGRSFCPHAEPGTGRGFPVSLGSRPQEGGELGGRAGGICRRQMCCGLVTRRRSEWR
jgi:hypothetical protein